MASLFLEVIRDRELFNRKPDTGLRAFLVFSPRRGQNKSAQGTALRRQPQRDALGTVSKQPGSPERAKQGGSSNSQHSSDVTKACFAPSGLVFSILS